MKKILSVLLVLVMVLSMAACGANEAEETNAPAETTAAPTTEAQVNAPASALEVLQSVWALYGDDEKFPVVGGNPDDMYMDGPSAWDMANTANMPYSLLVPEAQLASIDEAASMIHLMNANTFTCGVYHLTEGTDVAAFAQTMRDAIQGNQWMCGFPERMVVASFGGGYVMAAFGLGDAMNPFFEKLATVYADAELLFDEAIA